MTMLETQKRMWMLVWANIIIFFFSYGCVLLDQNRITDLEKSINKIQLNNYLNEQEIIMLNDSVMPSCKRGRK